MNKIYKYLGFVAFWLIQLQTTTQMNEIEENFFWFCAKKFIVWWCFCFNLFFKINWYMVYTKIK